MDKVILLLEEEMQAFGHSIEKYHIILLEVRVK